MKNKTLLILEFILIVLQLTTSAVFAETVHNTAPDVTTEEHLNPSSTADVHEFVWSDPSVPTKSNLLCIHGMAMNGQTYRQLGQKLAPFGITTYAIDIRGIGSSSIEQATSKFDLDNTMNDIEQVLHSIKQTHPGQPIFLLGESLGGSIALHVAAKFPESIDGVICSAPAWCIYKETRSFPKVLLGLITGKSVMNKMVGLGLMNQATSNEELKQQWIADSSHRLDLSVGELIALMKFTHSTKETSKCITSLPVLMVQGLHDHLVKPKGTATLFYLLPTTDKTFVVDGSAEHLVYEDGQFSDLQVQVVDKWIDAHLSKNELGRKIQAKLVDADNLSKADKQRVKLLFQKAHVDVQ